MPDLVFWWFPLLPFQSESVDLALQILDGYNYREHTIHVQRAKFELKGDYDPTKKRRKLTSKEKKKFKQKQEKWVFVKFFCHWLQL